MSVAFSELIRQGCQVVGVCGSEPPGMVGRLRGRVGRFVRRLGLREDRDFFYADPFASLPEPKAMADANRIPFFSASDLKTEHFRRALAAIEPDIILVAGFPRLVPTAIFELARTAAINLHPSLLPLHRGGTPTRWVVRAGENRHGFTAHWLDQKFDTGDILLQTEIAVEPDDCWGDVEQKLLGILPPFLKQALSLVATEAPRRAQDLAYATYEKPFKGRHLTIDWRGSPEEIRRTCLAIRPKSGGRTWLAGRPICIWDVARSPGRPDSSQPGQVLGFDDTGSPIVRCGEGEAVALRATLRNGVICSGAEMAAQMSLTVGDVFSSSR